jgi:exosortase H (IPTLxxWG-CTERM-specific)
LAICGVSFVGLAVLYFWLRDGTKLDPFLAFNASVTTAIVNLMGARAATDGAMILAGESSFRVIAECTSLIPTGVLVSMIVAWPSTLKQKMTGLGLGITLLFLVNVVRIVSLFYVAKVAPGHLDFAHFYVWGALTVLLIVAIWYHWARRCGRIL